MPAPGFYKGMQALTLSNEPTQPPALPHAYHPYQHLPPYFPYFNPYATPHPSIYTNNTPTPNDTSSKVVSKSEGAVDMESEVREWDDQGQVDTDAEDEPQHRTWADQDSYKEFYDGQGDDSTGEELY